MMRNAATVLADAGWEPVQGDGEMGLRYRHLNTALLLTLHTAGRDRVISAELHTERDPDGASYLADLADVFAGTVQDQIIAVAENPESALTRIEDYLRAQEVVRLSEKLLHAARAYRGAIPGGDGQTQTVAVHALETIIPSLTSAIRSLPRG